jgi:hypothetical protein
MSRRRRRRRWNQSAQGAGAAATMPKVTKVEFTATTRLREQHFQEALRQQAPLTSSPGSADRVGRFLQSNTARKRGLLTGTAQRQAQRHGNINEAARGANPEGKCAEYIAAKSYRDLHDANAPRKMVNPPPTPSRFIVDYRVSPDNSSRRDLIIEFRMNDGTRWFAPGGQVKVGTHNYVCDSLCKMARTPKYGKLGIVNARYVNRDGSPRVANNAFTQHEADRLNAVGVKLRGIPDLRESAKRLSKDIAAAEDARTVRNPHRSPTQREAKKQIDARYTAKSVMGRAMKGSTVGAAVGAVLNAAGQCLGEKKVKLKDVDLKEVAKASGTAGGASAATTALEAGVYHGVSKVATAETAQAAANSAAAFVAIGLDIMSEVQMARSGEDTKLGAFSHGAMKVGADCLSTGLSMLGPPGALAGIAVQIGVRAASHAIRKDEQEIKDSKAEVATIMDDMDERLEKLMAKEEELRIRKERILGTYLKVVK